MENKIEIKHNISFDEIAQNIHLVDDALKLIKIIDIHMDNQVFTEKAYEYFGNEVDKWNDIP